MANFRTEETLRNRNTFLSTKVGNRISKAWMTLGKFMKNRNYKKHAANQKDIAKIF